MTDPRRSARRGDDETPPCGEAKTPPEFKAETPPCGEATNNRERTPGKNTAKSAREQTDFFGTTETDASTKKTPARQSQNTDVNEIFESRFWRIWPHKVAKEPARTAFKKVWREIDAIVAGIDRYIATKPPDRQWLNPATFLNGRRWEDNPAPAPMPGGPSRRDSESYTMRVAMDEHAKGARGLMTDIDYDAVGRALSDDQ